MIMISSQPSITALNDMPIRFPGLFGDWEFNPDPIAIHIGHGIYWYGIILAVAMLLGMLLSAKHAKRYGLTEDNVTDLVLIGVPSCIIGARLYYVIFYLDLYLNADGGINWRSVVSVWDGGLAIYGAVIMGLVAAFVYSRIKKLPFGAVTDNAVLGLLLGQAIGRWANFINREAFGSVTTVPWRMQLYRNVIKTVDVHPTFFYESLWNVVGLLLILLVVSKARRFDGENTCFYFFWYGAGRLWIEGLRSDSLYVAIGSTPVRVSQLVSVVLIIVGVLGIFYNTVIRKKNADSLLVNRITDAQEADAAEDTADEEASSEAGASGSEAYADTEERSLQNEAQCNETDAAFSGDDAAHADKQDSDSEEETEENGDSD